MIHRSKRLSLNIQESNTTSLAISPPYVVEVSFISFLVFTLNVSLIQKITFKWTFSEASEDAFPPIKKRR